jgi:hypothetical protein
MWVMGPYRAHGGSCGQYGPIWAYRLELVWVHMGFRTVSLVKLGVLNGSIFRTHRGLNMGPCMGLLWAQYGPIMRPYGGP